MRFGPAGEKIPPKITGYPLRNLPDEPMFHEVKCCVDAVGVVDSFGMGLSMNRDHTTLSVHLDQIRIVGMVVRMYKEGGMGALAHVIGLHVGQINVTEGVAIHHPKRFRKRVAKLSECTGRAKRGRFFEVVYVHAPSRTIAKMGPNLVPEMADGKEKALNSLSAVSFDQMLQDGFARQGNHGFRHVRKGRLQACAFASGENHGRSDHALELCLELAREHVFRRHAHLLVYHLAIFENQKGRDIADAKLHGDFAFFVYVHFAYDGTAFKVLGELVHDGTNHTARTTPSGPKVYKYGGIRFQDKVLEVAFCNFKCHRYGFNK